MRILLAVDGSRAAERATELVAALPVAEGGRLRIVSVAPIRNELLGVPWAEPVPSDGEALDKDLTDIHREALDVAEREIRSARCDLVIETVMLRGRAASAIVDEAREMKADLVVVGHRGHGPWQSRLLGSVSAEVVDHAPCPVLVARDDRLGPVVFADDGSLSARTAEAALCEWPLFSGVDVTVLTVIEDAFPYAAAVAPETYTIPEYVDGRKDRVRLALEESSDTAKRLREAGFHANPEVREGDAAHQIVRCAHDREAGVIVVGTRGMTGLRRIVLGSVARNVLLHADCSVLVVREQASIVHDSPDAEAETDRMLVGIHG